MKKLNLQIVSMFFVSSLLFVSCLDGDGSNKEVGYVVGVVRSIDYVNNVLDIANDGPSLFSSVFANREGECYHIGYEIDYDLPENSYESVLAKGYYKVTVFDMVKVEKYGMSYSITDPSEVLYNEVAISDPVADGNGVYVKGILFIMNFFGIPADKISYWDLSCDFENVVTEENGQRYYDVFLRCVASESNPTQSTETPGIINAFDVKYYIEKIAQDEKNLGGKSFKLRFNYVSKIENGQPTWAKKDTKEILIEDILSSK